jgi:hypothetical protein
MNTLQMKISRIYILFLLLFLFVPSFVSAQKKKNTKKSKQSNTVTQSGKCSVVVRNDLIPNKVVVVVGCNSSEFFITTNGIISGGIVVLDDEFNPIFKWTACSACGYFSQFAGSKKVKGHNALLIKLDGRYGTVTEPLYFNGKMFMFTYK